MLIAEFDDYLYFFKNSPAAMGDNLTLCVRGLHEESVTFEVGCNTYSCNDKLLLVCTFSVSHKTTNRLLFFSITTQCTNQR